MKTIPLPLPLPDYAKTRILSPRTQSGSVGQSARRRRDSSSRRTSRRVRGPECHSANRVSVLLLTPPSSLSLSLSPSPHPSAALARETTPRTRSRYARASISSRGREREKGKAESFRPSPPRECGPSKLGGLHPLSGTQYSLAPRAERTAPIVSFLSRLPSNSLLLLRFHSLLAQ